MRKQLSFESEHWRYGNSKSECNQQKKEKHFATQTPIITSRMSPATRKTVIASSVTSSMVLPAMMTAGTERAQALAFSLASLQDNPAPAVRVESRSRSASYDEENEETDTTTDHGVTRSSIDPVKRLARCRERNREHARRTRIRKKVQLEALQKKCKGLQAEQANLKRILEDRRVASILLNLSGNADPSEQQQRQQLSSLDEMTVGVGIVPPSIVVPDHHEDHSRIKDKRKSPHSNTLCITVDGVPTVFSTKSHVNWKTGTYVNHNGEQQRLDARQLESLRYVALAKFRSVYA